MKFAVIIPTHNRVELFLEALKSVTNQSIKDIEIIVTDDSDNKDHSEIIEFFCKKDSRIKLVKTLPSLGQAKNTNQGLNFFMQKCKSPFVKIFHSDDILHPKCLEKELEILEYTECNLLFHDLVSFEKTPELKENVTVKLEKPSALIKNFLNVGTAVPSTVSFHRSLCSLMNDSLKFLCDWEMFFDMVIKQDEENRLISHLSPGLVGWRIHENSTSYEYFHDHYVEHANMIEKYSNHESVKILFDQSSMKRWKEDAKIYREQRYERDLKNR